MNGFPILSLMLLVPLVAAVACLVLPREQARSVALLATFVDFALGMVLGQLRHRRCAMAVHRKRRVVCRLLVEAGH